jgi:hypothetical protein
LLNPKGSSDVNQEESSKIGIASATDPEILTEKKNPFLKTGEKTAAPAHGLVWGVEEVGQGAGLVFFALNPL